MDPFDNIHNTPFGKPHFQKKIYWREMVKKGNVPIVDSICAWSDICGFESFLAAASFDLKQFIKGGPFDILASMNDLYGQIGRLHYKNLSTSFDDMDRCVILNDGIAKVVDIRNGALDPVAIAFWLRNLIIAHWQLLNIIWGKYKERTKGQANNDYKSWKVTVKNALF